MGEFGTAARKTEAELVRESIDANLANLHSQRWAVEAGRLRGEMNRMPDAEKAAAKQALSEHYAVRDNPEASRAPLIQRAMEQLAARQRG